MTQQETQKLKALLVLTSAYYAQKIPDPVLDLYVSDLADLPFNEVERAIGECRRDPKNVRLPLPAHIREKLLKTVDNRPGPEEAWAMLPKDEESTAVWTEEMQEAFSVCRGLLLDGDSVGARMAFKETYARLLERAKSSGKPAKWSVTLGQDPSSRTVALEMAVHKGYITADHAQTLLPDYSARPEVKRQQLTGPAEPPTQELTGLRDFMHSILKNAPENIQKQESAKLEIKKQERAGNVYELTPEEIEKRKRVLLDQARIIEADEQFKRAALPNPESKENTP